jgi:hypothetical protein
LDTMPASGAPAAGDLTSFAALAAELATLKRISDASALGSLASRLFRRAWASLSAGVPVRQVALSVSADALVALRLGGIERSVLLQSGLSAEQAADVLLASFDDAAGQVSAGARADLRRHVGATQDGAPGTLAFVEALIRQPRAGATCPGKLRLILEPPEGHGDHCLAVAVLGVLLCTDYQADPAPVFLAGLAHHLHNARLPDAGYAGEMLLGEHLTPILQHLTNQALQTLPAKLAATTRDALALAADAATPEGRAFNAADVIDRIMEVRHFAAVAGFTEAQALDDMNLVHAGPLQDFHHSVLRRAGLAAA